MKNLRKRTARILNRIANRLSPVREMYVNIKPTIQIKTTYDGFKLPVKLCAKLRTESFYTDIERAALEGLLSYEDAAIRKLFIKNQVKDHLTEDIIRALQLNGNIRFRFYRDETDGRRYAEATLYVLEKLDETENYE